MMAIFVVHVSAVLLVYIYKVKKNRTGSSLEIVCTNFIMVQKTAYVCKISVFQIFKMFKKKWIQLVCNCTFYLQLSVKYHLAVIKK